MSTRGYPQGRWFQSRPGLRFSEGEPQASRGNALLSFRLAPLGIRLSDHKTVDFEKLFVYWFRRTKHSTYRIVKTTSMGAGYERTETQ